MTSSSGAVVLGSRSPRRRELLAHLLGESGIVIRPPLDPNEPSLDDVETLDTLHLRLAELARDKSDDVVSQLRTEGSLAGVGGVLTADTVIVGTRPDGRPAVLGQPPTDGDWQATVRDWFQRYYFGREHLAVTAVCLTLPDGRRLEQVVTTQVRFRADGEQWLDWYLATGESLGKAGGYGLQEAGGLFVDHIDGSPSNVIGLPLRETAQLLQQAGLLPTPGSL